MIHRGEIIEQAIRQSGISITEVAKRLGKSRQHLYNLFDDPNISLDSILQIGKIIHYDFTKEIAELKSLNQAIQNKVTLQENDEYWKDKYLHLLEKYNSLLENQNE